MNSLSVLVVFRKRQCRYMQGIARAGGWFAANSRCWGLNWRGRAQVSSGIIRTRLPKESAGALAARTITQSARAKAAMSDESWEGGALPGVPRRRPVRHRPQVMLARAVGLQRLGQHRVGRGPCWFLQTQQPAQHRHQEHMGADQRRDRIAGQAEHRLAPSRPNISGLPGRMAIFQKSSSSPSSPSARWTRS